MNIMDELSAKTSATKAFLEVLMSVGKDELAVLIHSYILQEQWDKLDAACRLLVNKIRADRGAL